MADYDNTNRGSIFKNDKKEKETQPDFTGKLNVDGVDYFIDGWRYAEKPGKKAFISLKVKKMEKQTGGQRTEKKEKLDDEVPF